MVGELTAPCAGRAGFSTSSARERNRIELYKQLRKKNYTLIIERENLRFNYGSLFLSLNVNIYYLGSN